METRTALEAKLVQEFVGNAHGDLNRVKELLAQEPTLINSCWDWGGGDFETALGAAAHMGRRDIAEFLIAHARAGGDEARPVLEYLESLQ